MYYEFKCENNSCGLFEQTIEKNISYSELESQVCEKCGEPLKRIWNISVGIKTSDGYKS